MDRLIEGYARFREEVFPPRREHYEKLASEGQTPGALVVSCSDSRVMPEVITQCDPGDIFVTRNAGNIVPAYDEHAACAVTSAIEYAVTGLGVRHVVICGHTDCGAMKALLKPGAAAAMPSVAAWLSHCACVRESFVCDAGASDATNVRALAEANVAAQVDRLKTHPSVAAGLAKGTLRLHGWLFDIAAGELSAMKADGTFRRIDTDRRAPLVAAA